MIEEITSILDKKPGEMITYHRGLIATDRGTGLPASRRNSQHDAVNQTATIAWSLFTAGRIHLFQRRVGDGVYDYLAVRALTT